MLFPLHASNPFFASSMKENEFPPLLFHLKSKFPPMACGLIDLRLGSKDSSIRSCACDRSRRPCTEDIRRDRSAGFDRSSRWLGFRRMCERQHPPLCSPLTAATAATPQLHPRPTHGCKHICSTCLPKRRGGNEASCSVACAQASSCGKRCRSFFARSVRLSKLVCSVHPSFLVGNDLVHRNVLVGAETSLCVACFSVRRSIPCFLFWLHAQPGYQSILVGSVHRSIHARRGHQSTVAPRRATRPHGGQV